MLEKRGEYWSKYVRQAEEMQENDGKGRCHEMTARGGTRLESIVLGVEPCIAR